MPLHHQQRQARDDDPADDALVGRRHAVHRLIRQGAKLIRLAAQDDASPLPYRPEHGKENTDPELPAIPVRLVLRRERDCHSGQNHRTARHLRDRQGGAQPQPLHQPRKRRGEAMHDQDRQPRTQPRVSLEQRNIPQPEADATAQDEDMKPVARQPCAKRVRQHREEERRQREPPEVRLRAAHELGHPRAGDGGEGKQHSRKQGTQHGAGCYRQRGGKSRELGTHLTTLGAT